MKNSLSVLLALFTLQVVSAQIKEGKIVYEQKIDLHRRMQDEQMKAMVPQFRTSRFELNFADSQSVYKMQEEEPDITENTGNGGIVMKFGGANAEYYRNFITQTQVEKRELGDEDYIIEDSLRHIGWQPADETKVILGYHCKKASGKTERETMLKHGTLKRFRCLQAPKLLTGCGE